MWQRRSATGLHVPFCYDCSGRHDDGAASRRVRNPQMKGHRATLSNIQRSPTFLARKARVRISYGRDEILQHGPPSSVALGSTVIGGVMVFLEMTGHHKTQRSGGDGGGIDVGAMHFVGHGPNWDGWSRKGTYRDIRKDIEKARENILFPSFLLFQVFVVLLNKTYRVGPPWSVRSRPVASVVRPSDQQLAIMSGHKAAAWLPYSRRRSLSLTLWA